MIRIMNVPPPFDRLPDGARLRITLAAGATVFRQGDQTKGPFACISGAVKVVRYSATGQALTLQLAGPGETFADASLFADTYHCDAVALCDTVLIGFDRMAVLRAVQTDPEFALAVTQRLAFQVQTQRTQTAILGLAAATDRVMAGLDAFGPADSVTGFAARIGQSPEATSRALAKLVAQGRVARVARGRYALVPPPQPGG